ncbi:cobalamin biosynthesis family protein [Photobacterium atrarenae]|uniref:Cobalamin biosynthesis family protein n=1 Tax=Photobacterium atrarenae TaxID=865757 RepID=A0ABY5GEN6_9GAMM|nr:cobalamin biosynthesis family protein [Photobacterium atrarenae]UTV27326.1 cobalamin biosynthesis family protein [Photobacterium atrarenae]
MNELLAVLNTHHALLVLWGALAMQWLLPIPGPLHPLQFWQLIAQRIAERVNHPDESRQQQLLAGSLAWLLMWLTVLVLLVAVDQLVWIESIYQLILLWLALDWRNTAQFSKRFIRAYSREDKAYCRQLLESPLNRETRNLSLLGLGKAGAETQLMAYGRLVAGVLFWFALTGGIGALMYRLAVSLARTWSPSRAEYHTFGLPAVRILAVLDIIPLRLFALLICVGHNGKNALLGIRQQGENWLLPGPGWLLAATGHKLSLSLGGPAIYNSRKMERPRLGGPIAPAALHLSQINLMMNRRLMAWVIIQSCLLILIQGVT